MADDDEELLFDGTQDEEDEDLTWPSLTISQGYPGYPSYQSVTFGPYFDPVFPTNVSVLAGQTIVLQCRIIDLGDRVVGPLLFFLCICSLIEGARL